MHRTAIPNPLPFFQFITRRKLGAQQNIKPNEVLASNQIVAGAAAAYGLYKWADNYHGLGSDLNLAKGLLPIKSHVGKVAKDPKGWGIADHW